MAAAGVVVVTVGAGVVAAAGAGVVAVVAAGEAGVVTADVVNAVVVAAGFRETNQPGRTNPRKARTASRTAVSAMASAMKTPLCDAPGGGAAGAGPGRIPAGYPA